MSYMITYLIVLAMVLVATNLAVRKFFLTNDSAGYVFMAINWVILGLAAALFVWVVKLIGG